MNEKEWNEILTNWKNHYVTIKEQQQLLSSIHFSHFSFRLWDWKLKKQLKRIEMIRKESNRSFLLNEKRKYASFFKKINGYPLDEEQINAVITEEENNLVIAGAGSGKTLTILGKIRYLVEICHYQPDEILCISFTKAATINMEERIQKDTNYMVNCKTFHKLGLDIIRRAHLHMSIKIASNQLLMQVIEQYLEQDLFHQKKQLERFILFFNCYFLTEEDSTFETLKSKLSNSKELVSNVAEWMIANFLYLHQIDYKYQSSYPYYSDYHPTFYLVDYDLYIQFFHQKEEKDLMIQLHNKHQTKWIPIDFFSYQKGTLLHVLKRELKKYHVPFISLPYKELYYTILYNQAFSDIAAFKKLILTFIQLYKANEISFDSLYQAEKKKPQSVLKTRNLMFYSILESIYFQYQKELENRGEIDFHDMLSKATQIVKTTNIAFQYRYIIIDEYQDTSLSRYHLIKAIQEKTNAHLMAVGDDWQSIFRFTGCDLTIFLQFQQYFGNSCLLRIQNTYRNSQELIDIAGEFIMKNKKQMKKQLKSSLHVKDPLRGVYYSHNKYYDIGLIQALEFVLLDIKKNSNKHSVFLLGRNNEDIKKVLDGNLFYQKDDLILYKKDPSFLIQYMTIHKAKGLEEEHVVLINLENKTTGFPNKISSDKILQSVLNEEETIPYDEERRLFYVALTRAKQFCYLLIPVKQSSEFVLELLQKKQIKLLNKKPEEISNVVCPTCKIGHLVIRSFDHTHFLGCTNYPNCKQTFQDLSLLEHPVYCPKCGSVMIKRKNKYNQMFYGCGSYPNCHQTIDIDIKG